MVVDTWGYEYYRSPSRGGVKCPQTNWDFVQYYTGIGWWIGGFSFEWYIPTLILFYALAPIINKASNRCIGACIILSVVAGIALHEFKVLENIYMSYQRVPIFLMGFLVYRKYREGGMSVSKVLLNLSILFGVVLFGYAYKFKNTDLILSLEIRRYAMLLLLLPILRVITWLMQSNMASRVLNTASIYAKNAFAFLGAISMEIYLLHINHEYSSKMTDLLQVYTNSHLINIVWFALVVITAYIVHKLVKLIQDKLL